MSKQRQRIPQLLLPYHAANVLGAARHVLQTALGSTRCKPAYMFRLETGAPRQKMSTGLCGLRQRDHENSDTLAERRGELSELKTTLNKLVGEQLAAIKTTRASQTYS